MILPDFVLQELTVHPVYVLLAPVRHFIAAMLFRTLALQCCQRWGAPARSLRVFAHPALVLALAYLPDLDVYLGLQHRMVTHSLAFAAFIGLLFLIGASVMKRKPLFLYFLMPFAIVTSHVALDLFIEGGDLLNPFWPLATPFRLHTDQDWFGHVFTVLGLVWLWLRRHR